MKTSAGFDVVVIGAWMPTSSLIGFCERCQARLTGYQPLAKDSPRGAV
jgi:hypothetical protein